MWGERKLLGQLRGGLRDAALAFVGLGEPKAGAGGTKECPCRGQHRSKEARSEKEKAATRAVDNCLRRGGSEGFRCMRMQSEPN